MHADRIWRNARLATFKPQPGASNDGVGAVERGLVAAAAGRILYCGEESRAPEFSPTAERIDCEGRWITPGLIDCHTHLVYAGDRAAEFEQRLAGVTYEAIARAGGGIAASVRATRAASEEQLIAATLPRLDALLAEGLTTIEIKSGYGLEWPTERRMLLQRVRSPLAAASESPEPFWAHTRCRPDSQAMPMPMSSSSVKT